MTIVFLDIYLCSYFTELEIKLSRFQKDMD